MRRMRRSPILYALYLIFIAHLGACGGTVATTTRGQATGTVALPQVAPSPSADIARALLPTPPVDGPSGGTLTGAFDVGPGGSPQAFNPMTQGAGFLWTEKYFSKLVVYDVTFTRIQGELAESWEISPDATQLTVKLRRGVTWHDGHRFTSDDAKHSIDLIRNPQSVSPYAPKYADITEVAAPDPQTVVITTGRPNAAMLDALTFVFMLPKHHLGGIAPQDLVKHPWWSSRPVGTGPFKWGRYVPDQFVELVANEHYWRGRPKLDRLINRYFKEPGSALIALQRGEIQFVYVTADQAEIVKQDPNLTLIPGPSQVINFLQFNLKDPRFADVRVRQAFMYAIDRAAIAEQLFKGTAAVVPCVFDSRQYMPASGLSDYQRDVTRAKQLLQGANWAAIKGEPIEVLTYYSDQLSSDILVTVQQQLAEVGITITIRSVDVPTFNSIVYKATPEFTMFYAGAANGADPDVTSVYFLSTALPPAGANRGLYSNPELDNAYLTGRAELDPARRAAAYQRACTILNAELPWAPLWVTTRFGAVSKQVGNFVYTPSAGSGKYYDQAELWTVAR